MIEVTERLEKPELNQEMRLLYTTDNWIAFMINTNVVYQNVIISSGYPLLDGVKDANSKLGALFSREFRRLISSGVEFKTKDLLTIFDQFSRFYQANTSFLREIESKLLGQVSKPEQFLQILHVNTRIYDSETAALHITQIANTLCQHLSKLTYEQLGSFLESLLLCRFKPSQEFSRVLTKELEQRQKSLLTSESQEKLQIQECVKIYRSLMHLGCNHEVN